MFRAIRNGLGVACLAGIAAQSVSAQPALDSLWPSADGTAWHYRMTIVSDDVGTFVSPASLTLDGFIQHHGHELQVLDGVHEQPPALALTAPPLPPLMRAIWRARPDGSGKHPIGSSAHEERDPTVSPDGRFIVYVAEESGYQRLMVRPLDGSGDRPLLKDGDGLLPAW